MNQRDKKPTPDEMVELIYKTFPVVLVLGECGLVAACFIFHWLGINGW